MNNKNERHSAILKLVSERPIRTQVQLRSRLSRRGFSVNQATLSRDVRHLGLVKVAESGGGARYATVEALTPAVSGGAESLVGSLVRSVEASRNLLVVKTDPGNASPLGLAIDRLRWPQVAGTVAGDDTLLVVVREDAAAKKVARKLNSLRG